MRDHFLGTFRIYGIHILGKWESYNFTNLGGIVQHITGVEKFDKK